MVELFQIQIFEAYLEIWILYIRMLAENVLLFFFYYLILVNEQPKPRYQTFSNL